MANESNTPANTSTQDTSSTEVSDEIVETSEEDGAAAVEAASTPVEKKIEKALRKKFLLKVDGRDIEEEVDLDNEEDLKRRFQLGHVAQKRMGEKAQLEKEVREFFDTLRKNPRKILSDPNLGVDLKELAKSIIQEDMENSLKSPEMLEKERIERELRDLKENTEKEREEYKRKEFERLQEKEFERYDNLMSQALDKSDLPKTPYVVKKMADYMLLGLQNNLDLAPEDVLPHVREEILSDIKDMFSAMPEKVVEEILGKDILGKLRKKTLAKKAIPPASNKLATDTGEKGKKEGSTKKAINYKDYFGI